MFDLVSKIKLLFEDWQRDFEKQNILTSQENSIASKTHWDIHVCTFTKTSVFAYKLYEVHIIRKTRRSLICHQR